MIYHTWLSLPLLLSLVCFGLAVESQRQDSAYVAADGPNQQVPSSLPAEGQGPAPKVDKLKFFGQRHKGRMPDEEIWKAEPPETTETSPQRDEL
ncbi:hypothetical protein FRB94_012131 [Tulasnella sp. JGI-2019a]|nr:hypothetical protein FRB93_010507 [Tulasnella sp. JGI-2019a]KAG8991953.1 hypothetical protein FRB94_012131 [Tulasnella sp. JGI-2019a]KAG9024140.1 hypothetical protein FRB95_012040 [Tulasnella sp. JGI-2019a]